MENDLFLKHFLINDTSLNKIELKLSLDYLKCKVDNCYSKNEKNKITHEDFEDCKDNCMNNLNKFQMMKEIMYQDLNKFYYERFLICSNDLEEEKYNKCIDEDKKLMSKDVEKIKNILLNYKFS